MPKNLKDKRDAIARIVALMSRYSITLQDIIDEYNRIMNQRKRG